LQTLSQGDSETLIGPNLQFAPDYSGASLSEEIATKVFASDVTEDIRKLILSKNKIEPLAPFQTKLTLSEANFGVVPKYYIETLKDLGVGNSLQKKMVADNGKFVEVYSLDCGHNPYFAKPTELVEILATL